MKELDKAMRKLDKKRTALAEELAGVASSDHVAMADVGTRLAAVEAELGAAEDEWLALSEETGR